MSLYLLHYKVLKVKNLTKHNYIKMYMIKENVGALRYF